VSASQATVQGTLKPDGTLELDEKPNLPHGRVQVTLASISGGAAAEEDIVRVLQRIREEREKLRLTGRSREEVDTDLRALRAEWENRMERLDRIRGAAPEAKEQHGC
jgi:hypothetical protein